MLSPVPQYVLASDQDREVFNTLVPPDHYLRRAAAAIDFEQFRPLTAAFYNPSLGRPAIEPVLLLRLEFLKYHDRLSDGQVIAQAQVNVAYREFLGLSLKSDLPDPSTLCRFRGRLGAQGFCRVFDNLVGQAREHGLVKDRLRLKDATHVVADVAIPSAIHLVAGIRDRLLAALAAFDPLRIEGERTGWIYQFSAKDCQACPRRTQCFGQPSARAGRRVNKGDYVAEYRAVRQKAQTAEYKEVRRTHQKVERKLGEIVRHHGGRRARCRGLPKVLIQEVMTALVVNVRRMTQLLCAGSTPCAAE